MDSIVGGIPMTKVKFNAQTEYDYIHNFKILQASFTKHKVNKTIDVERLVKCRLQDNLLLLQWFKKFWHENKDVNGVYDAASKRKVSGLYSNGSGFSVTPQERSRTSSRRTTLPSRVPSTGRTSITPNTPTNTTNKLAQLNKELADTTHELSTVNEELLEYKILAESLETERNFYFNKLREIEILTENLKHLDESEFSKLSVNEFIEKVQSILYSTEEGFQSSNDQVDIDGESF
jgi:RP/EB family microtubule-associated protein